VNSTYIPPHVWCLYSPHIFLKCRIKLACLRNTACYKTSCYSDGSGWPHCSHHTDLCMTPDGALRTDHVTSARTATDQPFILTLRVSGIAPPPKRDPSRAGTCTPSVWFLWTTRVYIPTGISIGSGVSAGLMVGFNRQTHARQTDRHATTRYTVCSNRPHLATAAMWPKNKHETISNLHFVKKETIPEQVIKI